MLFPRPGRPGYEGRAPRVLETIPFFPFHHVNAFEVSAVGATQGNEPQQIIVDTIAWDEVCFDVNQYSVTAVRKQGMGPGDAPNLHDKGMHAMFGA